MMMMMMMMVAAAAVVDIVCGDDGGDVSSCIFLQAFCEKVYPSKFGTVAVPCVGS